MDLTLELARAVLVAKHAIEYPERISTKYVSHLGLNASFSDMILRYYHMNPPKTFRPEKVKLLIAGSKVKPNVAKGTVYVPPLRATIRCEFPEDFRRVRRVMFDDKYAFINLEVQGKQKMEVEQWFGVDMNIIGPLAVLWIPTTGEALPLGKDYYLLAKRYELLQNELRKAKKYRALSRVSKRRADRIDDLLHKVSHEIVALAARNHCGIRLEDLRGVRNKVTVKRAQRRMVNRWPYFKLRTFVVYKARRAGVPVQLVNPAYTSLTCAVHKIQGVREGRLLKCPLGHIVDVDANGARLIAGSRPKYEL